MQQVAAMSILPTTMMKICPVVVSACCTVFILNEPLCFVATPPLKNTWPFLVVEVGKERRKVFSW